jgi:hypothetical protein
MLAALPPNPIDIFSNCAVEKSKYSYVISDMLYHYHVERPCIIFFHAEFLGIPGYRSLKPTKLEMYRETQDEWDRYIYID